MTALYKNAFMKNNHSSQSKKKTISKKSVIITQFENLFNVRFDRIQLDSHFCFCFQSVATSCFD